MNKRVIFLSDLNRKLFFEKTLEFSFLHSWSKLAVNLNISRNLLGLYRSGKLLLPEKIFVSLTSNLNSNLKRYFLKRVAYRDQNWGRRKAGKITYKNHEQIFIKGRMKGLSKLKELNKKTSFDIYMPLNSELSYFLGLFVGDGFCNKYGRHYQIQFTGCKSQELSFYKEYFSSLTFKLFGILPKIIEKMEGDFIRINYYSKDIFNLITQRFGIKRGYKSKSLVVPKEILDSNEKIILSFIAGVFDAEGCIFFDRRHSYNADYPRLDIHMLSPLFIKQLSKLLEKYVVSHWVNKDFNRIVIYGFDKSKRFLSKVPIKNPKHLAKAVKLGPIV